MKKTKLAFSRQTIRLLSKEPLAKVNGGAVNTHSCRATDCCWHSFFDSCYNTQCCLEKP